MVTANYNVAGAVGLREVRYGFEGSNHLDAETDNSNPYFAFDPSKCIVCSRCVRACAEVQGTFTNAERRINRVRKVMAPVAGKEDWEVTVDLSNALGYPMNYRHPSEIMDEIALLTPSFEGVSYQKLEELGSIQWPCDDEHPEGTPTMHTLDFPIGKGHFAITDYVATDERTNRRDPCRRLVQQRRHYHQGARGYRSPQRPGQAGGGLSLRWDIRQTIPANNDRWFRPDLQPGQLRNGPEKRGGGHRLPGCRVCPYRTGYPRSGESRHDADRLCPARAPCCLYSPPYQHRTPEHHQ